MSKAGGKISVTVVYVLAVVLIFYFIGRDSAMPSNTAIYNNTVDMYRIFAHEDCEFDKYISDMAAKKPYALLSERTLFNAPNAYCVLFVDWRYAAKKITPSDIQKIKLNIIVDEDTDEWEGLCPLLDSGNACIVNAGYDTKYVDALIFCNTGRECKIYMIKEHNDTEVADDKVCVTLDGMAAFAEYYGVVLRLEPRY